jgi:hypothetical protein
MECDPKANSTKNFSDFVSHSGINQSNRLPSSIAGILQQYQLNYGIGRIGTAPNGFGATPNIAPPSNLKFLVSIGYSFIFLT